MCEKLVYMIGLLSYIRSHNSDFSKEMEVSYMPRNVEAGWSQWWQENGFFTPDAKASLNLSDTEKFIMVIPPPNVTGSLHLGHTLTNAIQDALTRW